MTIERGRRKLKREREEEKTSEGICVRLGTRESSSSNFFVVVGVLFVWVGGGGGGGGGLFVGWVFLWVFCFGVGGVGFFGGGVWGCFGGGGGGLFWVLWGGVCWVVFCGGVFCFGLMRTWEAYLPCQICNKKVRGRRKGEGEERGGKRECRASVLKMDAGETTILTPRGEFQLVAVSL